MLSTVSSDLLREARTAHRVGALDRATISYQKLTALSPALPEAIHVLGGLDIDGGLGERGLEWLRRSLYLEPQNATFLLNVAVGLQRFSRFDQALGYLQQALLLKPLTFLIQLNLGHVYKELKKYVEARNHYRKSIAIDPAEYASYDHLSLIDDIERDLSACVRNVDRAIAISCLDDPDLLYRKGIYCLLLGQFVPGWDLVEYRWTAPQILKDAKFTKPLQTSKPLFQLGAKPGVLFLWAEQGIGDEIMFGALIADILPLVKGVILQADARLHQLFSRAYPQLKIIPRGERPVDFEYDYHLPIGSLARLFRRNTDEFFNAGAPYLTANSDQIKDCLNELDVDKSFRIGISWYSKNGDHRCVDLDELVAKLARPGIQLVNLQYGNFSSKISMLNERYDHDVLIDTGIDCKDDIEKLAALISCCDLVISIGNATAHLAGALGVKTWMMLPSFPGWRWLSHGVDSLWYRSMRIYRQPRGGDWGPVLRGISDDLAVLLSAPR
jgi:hypothetical protein